MKKPSNYHEKNYVETFTFSSLKERKNSLYKQTLCQKSIVKTTQIVSLIYERLLHFSKSLFTVLEMLCLSQ